jgi:hypothetical protein
MLFSLAPHLPPTGASRKARVFANTRKARALTNARKAGA